VKVKLYTNDDRAAWDNFVQSSKNSHFMFMRDYMEYHSDRFSDFSLIVRDESDALVAILPANLDDRTLYSHQGLTFGGLCVQKSATTILVYEIFEAIVGFLKETNMVETLVYKRLPDFYAKYPSQEDLYALFRLDAKLIRRDVSLAIEMQNPLPVSKMRLRRVSKAKKLGVYVEETTSLAGYWDILEQVLMAQHNVKPVHSLSEIERLRESFPNNIRCFLAKKDHEVIAGTIVYENGDVAHTQYLANSIVGREVGGLDFLINELISDVYSSKKYFDFGIATEDLGRTLNTGLLRQKEGFGGRALVYEFYSVSVS